MSTWILQLTCGSNATTPSLLAGLTSFHPLRAEGGPISLPGATQIRPRSEFERRELLPCHTSSRDRHPPRRSRYSCSPNSPLSHRAPLLIHRLAHANGAPAFRSTQRTAPLSDSKRLP